MMTHAAAVPLVHAHHVHACSQPIPGYSQHVLRVCRSFQAMHHNERRRVAAIALPVTQTKDADAGFDLDQSPFGGWQTNSPLQKKASKGLYMAAPQPSPRFKTRARVQHHPVIRKALLRLGYPPCRLRSLQSSPRLILIETAGCLVI